MSADSSEQVVAQTPGDAPSPGDSSAPAADGAVQAAEGAQVDATESLGGEEPRDGGAGGASSEPRDGEAAEVEGDLDELMKAAAERDEYLALAQRTQADFENYRKRVARESSLAQERGVAKLAKELLPALDNLDRAVEEAASAAANDEDPLVRGVRLVRSELSDALARLGVESFSPAGETFDPGLHEAMASTPQPADGAPSGTVVEVYQPGYRLGEQVIRPARVVVAA
jgi:molecular chaperone GrpE